MTSPSKTSKSHYKEPPMRLFLALAISLFLHTGAWATTLTYEGTNHWLTPTGTPPLKELIQKTAHGQRTFHVSLPAENRPLSIERLKIIQKSLEKAASSNGLVIEETNTASPPNTLIWE